MIPQTVMITCIPDIFKFNEKNLNVFNILFPDLLSIFE